MQILFCKFNGVHPFKVSYMYKKIVLFGFMVSIVLLPYKVAFSETLQDSVTQALIAHPSVEAALAGKDVAKQTKKEVRSDLFPILSAGTSVGRIYSDNSTSRGLTVSRGAAYSGLWEGNATLTQPLFDGMETKNRIDAANARMQSADYNVLDIRENLALRAAQAHIGVLQAQATLERTKSYFSAIEDYLARIQLMVDEGVADESEAAQARNISLMLKSTLIDYEGQLNAALANYNEIVGRLPRTTLIKPSPVISIASDIEGAVAYARNNHPLLKSKEKEMEAIGYEIKAEKGTLYPDIDAELSGIKRDQREEIGGELKDARALLKLSWDFETGGASKARTQKSKAQYSEIIAQNKEQLRTIEGDIRRAYAELGTAEKQVDLVKRREAVTSELFEAYKTQFEGARVRLLQLMQAENQLFNSQLEVIAAEYRHLFAQYNVLASIGQLQKSVIENMQPDFKSVEHSVPTQQHEILNQNPVELEKNIEPKSVRQQVVVPEPQPVRKVDNSLPNTNSSERVYITVQ